MNTCPGPHQQLVYNYEQAAAQISISERTLRQMIVNGELRSIGYGEGRRRRGVTHEALVAWVGAREIAEQ
ncbi:DNA binding domain-containing protein, excisionase family [Klenkia soli]|uniref:DNA binding domain-containing protein, excisionase family n=1 Tax=Klenkia soli TaxID=1052260 RepID=A0A1H0T028_9ACTN|nr:hypothetical protein [Klenkia soli]SDP46848.1 DNA binding domain-containing protein, excisionase family [Klenkia soli]